ncbi:uncharacterized protein EDB91DRAFT_1250004 [Suillus paluster]|uniref:uncharacterized protein n=1 Tax=Suillus paluster TaxID=48578 RepID=UPI001B882D60|nr:uncharacterized protein EDB91DRAFT_1250004 [Suillus paluster]KAG1736391.1 hypothetical protein EDB91DRAFT_1250004 [Suillus paluster]
MASKIPSRKHSAINTWFNPYGRPTLRSLMGTVNAYEMQEMEWGIKASIKSYERELRQCEDDKDVWMGSAMDLDLNLPISAGSGTYGCVDSAMANNEEIGPLAIIPMMNCSEARQYQYQSPKKRKLVCSLHKGINKYINNHCKRDHANTDQLCERMYIALQAALLDVDVDDIMLPDAGLDQAQAGKHSKLQQGYLISREVAQ